MPVRGEFAQTSWLLRGLLSLLVTSSSGCTQPSPSPLPSPPATTLTVATAIPPTRATSTGVDAIIDSLTLEAPLRIGWDGQAEPLTVDKWHWSADGRTLRLHLRPGVTFHNGTALTNAIAADILRAELKSGPFMVSTTVQSVTAEGGDEIVIRTGQPEGLLLSDISIANFSLPGHRRVGTGPFQLDPGTDPISFSAFDAYHDGRPPIGRVTISKHDSQRQAWAAMMRGDADALYEVSVDSLDFVTADDTSFQTYSFLRAYYHALVFNLTLPLFAQKDVRRALNAAVDRDAVVEIGLRKRGMPAHGPIWPHHFGHSAEQPGHRYDPARAEALLDGLGLTRARPPQAGAMPSRFRFTCLVPQEDQRLQRIALLLQKQLFAIGVDMVVDLKPFREMQARMAAGQFEAALSEFGALRSLGFVYVLWHSPTAGAPGLLNLHYRSADQALERFRAAVTTDDVRAAVAELQRAFHDDPPAVFLDWMETARSLRKDIVVPGDDVRDIWASIHDWSPSTQRAGR